MLLRLKILVVLLITLAMAGPVHAERITAWTIPEDDPQVAVMAKQTELPAGKLKKVKGRTSYILKNKKRLKDAWICVRGRVYWLNHKGYARTGLRSYKGFYYYFDSSGRMASRRMVTVRGKTYFCSKTGAIVRSGWKCIRGYWCYFQANGAMARAKWIGPWYVGKDGRLDMDRGKKKLRTRKFKASKKSRLIIVGASRVTQMERAVGTDRGVIYIAQSETNGIRRLEKKLKKFPRSTVVIQLGNNDIRLKSPDGFIDQYIEMYTDLFARYPKARFYVMDALPGKSPEGDARNELRVIFNDALRTAFPDRYIGGYDFLMKTGYVCSYDINHYSDNTSRKIFNYILRKVKKR